MNLAAVVQELGVFQPIADAVKIQMFERVGENMRVE